ncbi:hypothetical protein ACFQHW_05200 [Lapidilactobacillus achengensis]|uniref:Uncharacterized protein n=1 Tax=Lapidilactobacillus achengensis TaxID=2486000 RepID=A0ABW1UMR0_9LACO|nr:hypothetical protein [Lapidilactobacillus achengensis]
MKPIPKVGIVFKSSLVLSGRAAKDNFTTEPRSPSRLLGRIEPICNQSWVFDEVLLQARGQTIARFLGWYGNVNEFGPGGRNIFGNRASLLVSVTNPCVEID